MPTVNNAANTSRAVDIWIRSASVIAAIVLALLSLAVPADAQSYTLAPTPYQTFLDNSGKIVNNGCIWTYIAGTTTAITTYADAVGTPNLNPIRSGSDGRFTAYLVPGSAYKFQYESTCTPPFTHGPILRTADNITATPATSATVDVVGLAGEGITAGQCVYLSAGDGGKSSGQWYRCDPTNAYSAITNWVGIALVNIQAAGTGTIRAAGEVTGLSSLSVGAKYYAGSLGTLTTTAPAIARLLGEADSATSLLLTANPVVAAIPITAPTNGQIPIGNGTTYTLAALTAGNGIQITNASGAVTIANGVLDRQVSTQTVANTNAETAVYTFAVPGGTLSTNRTIHVSVVGNWKDNASPGGHVATMRFKYGGTTFISQAITSSGQSAGVANFSADFELTATGATNTQAAKGALFTGDGGINNGAGSDFTTVGGGTTRQMSASFSAGAIDSTASQNLVVSVQFSFADPNLTATIKSVYTEVK